MAFFMGFGLRFGRAAGVQKLAGRARPRARNPKSERCVCAKLASAMQSISCNSARGTESVHVGVCKRCKRNAIHFPAAECRMLMSSDHAAARKPVGEKSSPDGMGRVAESFQRC